MFAIARVSVTLAALFAASAAAAQAGKFNSQSPYLAELEQCQAITANDARLRCLDAAVGRLLGATKQGRVNVIDERQATEVRRSLFGFSVPKLAILGAGDKQDTAEITGKVTRVSAKPDGRYHLQLEDGAVWETVERPRRGEGPNVGSEVRLRWAALGSYLMNIDGRRALRARRVS